MSYKLVRAEAGDRGQPGQKYEIITATLNELKPNRFEVKVIASRGSNQGHLEEHHGLELSARGDSVAEAIDGVREDVDMWSEWLTQQERNQLLRDLEYAYEDFVE